MTALLMSALAVLAVSAVSLIGLFTLSWRQDILKRMLFLLISLAAGALLGDAFIHLIPEAFAEAGNPLTVSLLILAGILSFFVLEKYLRWHHSHGDDEFSPEHARVHPLGQLVIGSDAVHNLVDGIAIGAAFIVSPEIGVATTVAIALHEIPQEIGDFGLLLHSGFSRMRALFLNFLSALAAFVGLGIAFTLTQTSEAAVPLIAAFTAGNFIYIACADLVPELHKSAYRGRSFAQIAMLVVGLTLMLALAVLE